MTYVTYPVAGVENVNVPTTLFDPPVAAVENVNHPTTLLDLSDELLERIWLYFPIEEAITSSVICSRFKNLWHSLPALFFNFSRFQEDDEDYSIASLFEFFQFISCALLRRSQSTYPLLVLTLVLPSTPDLRLFNHGIDSYLDYAVARKAIILDIRVIPVPDEPNNDIYYDFSFSLLKNGGCVKTLLLERVGIVDINNVNSLTRISLKNIHLSDDTISKIFECCINLEEFEIKHCHGMTAFTINSKSIRILKLQGQYDGSVLIRAPKLSEFYVGFFDGGQIFMEEGTPELAKIWCDNEAEKICNSWLLISRLHGGVKNLVCRNWGHEMFKAVTEDPIFNKLSLNNLRFLKLMTGLTKSDILGISTILRISPNLETLILEANNSEEEDPPEIEETFENIRLSLPSLRLLRIRSHFVWGSAGKRLLKLIYRDELALEKVVIQPLWMTGRQITPIVIVKQDTRKFKIVQGKF